MALRPNGPDGVPSVTPLNIQIQPAQPREGEKDKTSDVCSPPLGRIMTHGLLARGHDLSHRMLRMGKINGRASGRKQGSGLDDLSIWSQLKLLTDLFIAGKANDEWDRMLPGKCTLLQKSDPDYEDIGASISTGKYSSTDSKPSIEDFCGMQPLLSHALQARG